MTKLNVFIDESGNAGNVLLNRNLAAHIIDEPFHTLVGIGLEKDDKNLAKKVNELKEKYGIKSKELKSYGIFNKFFGFIFDLTEYIVKKEYPLFIEIVEKRHFLILQLIESIIFHPNCYITEDKKKMKDYFEMKKYFSNVLYEDIPNEVLLSFCKACDAYTKESFETFFLKNFIQDFVIKSSLEYKEILLGHLELTWNDYQELQKTEKSKNSFKSFLPLPDQGLKKQIVLSPHIPSFIAIMCRIQKYIDSNDCRTFNVVHDNQDELEKALSENLEQAKNMDKKVIEEINLFESSNFKLNKNISLEFRDSKSSIFIQIADLIAGTFCRIYKYHQVGTSNREHFQYLLLFKDYCMKNEARGMGFNQVVNHNFLDSIF